MRTLELSDICTAYLEGYVYAKITESLITGQIKSSYLDALKKIAVESVKNYIEHSAFSFKIFSAYLILFNVMQCKSIQFHTYIYRSN